MSKHYLWTFRLKHIVRAIDEILTFVAETDETIFQENIMLYRAVERNFEIIGEASSKIPDEIKNQYSDVPWSLLKAQRNFIIHDYDGVDLPSLWSTIQNDLIPLRKQMEEILQKETNNDNQ